MSRSCFNKDSVYEIRVHQKPKSIMMLLEIYRIFGKFDKKIWIRTNEEFHFRVVFDMLSQEISNFDILEFVFHLR